MDIFKIIILAFSNPLFIILMYSDLSGYRFFEAPRDPLFLFNRALPAAFFNRLIHPTPTPYNGPTDQGPADYRPVNPNQDQANQNRASLAALYTFIGITPC